MRTTLCLLLAFLSGAMPYQVPRIIQGGMGIRISSWQLAREVSRKGELGVISGTVLDTVFVRELQNGTSISRIFTQHNC
jgi:NAD(P)H-dependent flavin oxidoreductase YrpB (nitropropane dioxygenase family)